MRSRIPGALLPLLLSACGGPREIPEFIAVGDVDGDGRADALQINRGFLSLSFLKNDGQGSLERAADFDGIDFRLGIFADRGVLGDVDGDGDLDLLAESFYAEDGEQVLLNGGAGDFLPGDVVPEAGFGLALVDLDADGDLDIAGAFAGFIAEEGAEPLHGIRVLRNDGAGNFGDPEELLLGSAPAALAAGDVDGDGDIDLALATERDFFSEIPAGLQVLRNDGAGRFAAAEFLERSFTRPDSLAVGDLDGDGDLDAAVADRLSGRVELFRNDGAGAFTAGESFIGADEMAERLIAADINDDGRLDLVFLSGERSQVLSVLLGGGDGAFSRQEVSIGATKTFSLIDLDGDGRAELLRVPRAREVVESQPLPL
jgi:hypothetical protein